MAIVPAPKDQWYVVHVLSGQEQKVRNDIARRVEAEEMGDYVFEVLVPTERVSEVRKGKTYETKKKFYPGYIIANLYLLDENNKLVDKTWYFIQETNGCIGFAGTKTRPIPMRPKEVESMLAQIKEREENVKPAIQFVIGEVVKVSDGPFQSQQGTIQEINQEKGSLIVAVEVFGRETPIELEYWQIEKSEL